MPAIHLPYPVLTLRAGRSARAHLAQSGLAASDVSALPGAAGGPKALGLNGLDKAVFGWLSGDARERDLIGASIGGWRFACAMQMDAASAFDRLAEFYTDTGWGEPPSRASVTATMRAMLEHVLGPEAGWDALTRHPHYRLTLLLARARHLGRSEARAPLFASLALAATLNGVKRRLIGACYERVLCHDARSPLAFAPCDALPTRHVALDTSNIGAALMGTVAIPGLIEAVSLPGDARRGVYRDGGLTDYHLDFPFARTGGITLYPHFGERIVPGWFDKALPWRRASATGHARTLLVAPSREYLASLRLGGLPDRRDFKRFARQDATRKRLWRQAIAESARLGDAWLEHLHRQDWGLHVKALELGR